MRDGAYKKNCLALDLSRLNEPLYLDADQKIACVEPQMTFEMLARWTISLGYISPVVPEFKTITLGGAVMGSALESGSHLYGQFNDICLSYECILGNGDIIEVSENSEPDLFYGLSGSYGTLALITLITFKVVPAKKFVSLSVHHFSDYREGLAFLKKPAQCDYVESVLFNRNACACVHATQTDSKAAPLLTQKPWSRWYAERLPFLQKARMRLEEYLFRYDRGAFWMGRYMSSVKTILQAFLQIGEPKISKARYPSLPSRLLFGAFFSSKKLYALWHLIPPSAAENLFFVHDFYIPQNTTLSALDFLMESTEIFPIWLCPVKGTNSPQFLSPHFGQEKFINIGLYGIPKTRLSIPALSAEMEKVVYSFGGRKMLYSLTYYDLEFFSKIYDLEKYARLRKKFYSENAFLHLYNKVTNNP